MHLIHLVTHEYPRNLWQVRQDNPNVSFPEEPTDNDLRPFQHANVHPTPQPTWDPATERLEEGSPSLDANGEFRQTWLTRPATPEEVAEWEASQRVPDWSTFKATALGSAGLNAVLIQAYQACPVAAGALAPALLRAEQGDVGDFAASWAAICAAVPVDQGLVEAFVRAATSCHLPAAFVAALQPLPG